MRRILGFILVLCMVFTVLSGLAEETAGTAGNAVPTLEEITFFFLRDKGFKGYNDGGIEKRS